MYRPSLNNLLLLTFFAVLAVSIRLMPHPANFTPVGAIAIMGGALLARKYAAWLPLAIMIVTDLVIGLHPLIAWTWGSFALVAVLSNMALFNKKLSAVRVVIAALSAGLLFFVFTNFGVWLQSGMYVHTLSGLVQCYINALPFLRNTLMGDVFFSASMFAVYLLLAQKKSIAAYGHSKGAAT